MSRNALLILIVSFLAPLALAGTYSGGTGDPNSPYLIEKPNDIIEMSNTSDDWNRHFLMIADVNMKHYSFTTAVIAPDLPDTTHEFDGTPFTGTFDGADYKISNLTIDTEGIGNDYLGLFGQIKGEQAEIKNLGLQDCSITEDGGTARSGGLCGVNDGGTINNCYATCLLSFGYGHLLGGLCGSNSGTITNCYTNGSVSAGHYTEFVGGLCGSSSGTISNCYSTCAVSGSDFLGGVCGGNSGTISNCYTTGVVSADLGFTGGLCGTNFSGTIINSCSTGAVFGGDNIGGLCGENYNGTIRNCYATGAVTSFSDITYSPAGGLCGANFGTIDNCCAMGYVSGIDYLGGLCGVNGGGTISNSYSTGKVYGNAPRGALCGYQAGSSAEMTNSFWDTETSVLVGYNLDPDYPGTVTNVLGMTTNQM